MYDVRMAIGDIYNENIGKGQYNKHKEVSIQGVHYSINVRCIFNHITATVKDKDGVWKFSYVGDVSKHFDDNFLISDGGYGFGEE